MTQNISRRLDEHNAGKSKFTSGHLPWKIIYSEEFATSTEARVREKYLKSASGKKYIKVKSVTVPCPNDSVRRGFRPWVLSPDKIVRAFFLYGLSMFCKV
ncbi:MAG: GIY-YIG nuclease family protein [Cyclobacteriaceae bacterium]